MFNSFTQSSIFLEKYKFSLWHNQFVPSPGSEPAISEFNMYLANTLMKG